MTMFRKPLQGKQRENYINKDKRGLSNYNRRGRSLT